MLSWMAWTWPTAFLFLFIFMAIFLLALIERARPGGDARKGLFFLVTTRGDRLFISLLGSLFIFLLWLGFISSNLWPPFGLALAWGALCFWKG